MTKPLVKFILSFQNFGKKIACSKNVGTLFTCLRWIFSPANFNQSCCRILVFTSRRAKKVAKWKIGFILKSHLHRMCWQPFCFFVILVDLMVDPTDRWLTPTCYLSKIMLVKTVKTTWFKPNNLALFANDIEYVYTQIRSKLTQNYK